MISVAEIQSLQRLLQEHEAVPLRTLKARFEQTFLPNDSGLVCCVLAQLYSDGLLLNPAQRVAALYLIHAHQRNTLWALHPFLSFWLDSLETAQTNPGVISVPEQNMLISLLQSNNYETITNMTPQDFVRLHSDRITPITIDLTPLRRARQDFKEKYIQGKSNEGSLSGPLISPLHAHAVNPLIYAPDESVKQGGRLDKIHEYVSINPLRPQFTIIPPSPSSPYEDEIQWLHPETTFQLLWDPSTLDEHSPKGEFRRLMGLAFEGTLDQAHVKFMLEQMEVDPNVISQSGLSPGKLPSLIENNSQLAAEILLKLMGTPNIKDYLAELINMETGLHSMEVVNKLSSQANLPTEFLQQFIDRCISLCRSQKDKYVQHRYVRLVCVFLQSLIRNKSVNAADVFLPVQSFCIEFSRIGDAVTLFRLLGTLVPQ